MCKVYKITAKLHTMPAAETVVVAKWLELWCMERKLVGLNLAVGIWLFIFLS